MLDNPTIVPSSPPTLKPLIPVTYAAAACRHYRKVVVSSMPQLNYLDDAPVADQDRRLAAAFMQVSRLRPSSPWLSTCMAAGKQARRHASSPASKQAWHTCSSAATPGICCALLHSVRCLHGWYHAAELPACHVSAPAAARVAFLQRPLSGRPSAAKLPQQHSSSATTLTPWWQQHGQHQRHRMIPCGSGLCRQVRSTHTACAARCSCVLLLVYCAAGARHFSASVKSLGFCALTDPL